MDWTFFIIGIAIFFIVVLALLVVLRPVWILKRDRRTGLILDSIDPAKLLGWTVLFSIIFMLLFYIIMATSGKGYMQNGKDDMVL